MSKAPAHKQPSSLRFLDLFDAFYAQRKSAQLAESTLELFEFTTRRFCIWAEDRDLTPASVTRRDISTYLAELGRSRLAKATVNQHGRNIRTMMKFGNLDGLCPDLDFKGLLPRPPKRKKPVAREEDVQKLLAQEPSIRDRAIVLLMFESGIRRREAVNLNWGDLDFSPEDLVRITVRSGKGDKDRLTFCGPRSRSALLEQRQRVPSHPSDPVFDHRWGGRLGIQGIHGVFKRLCQDAGLDLTPHAFRRGFAVEHRRMGVWDLQRLLGHASVETTRLYVQTDEDDLLDSYRAHLTS